MSTEKVDVTLPVLEDSEAHEEFVRHTLALAARLSDTIDEYIGEVAKANPDNAPGAYAVGAACYVAMHVVANNLPDDDQRAADLKGGLFATMVANDDALKNAFPPNLNN